MNYMNSKNLLFMVILSLIMILTFAHAIAFEDNNSGSIYANANGYQNSK